MVPIYRGTAAEAGTIKPVTTPNGSPSAEGSLDYNDTSVPIKSLKQRCVVPPNRCAGGQKNCKPKSKPKAVCNKLYRRITSKGLKTVNISKEITAS